MVDRPTIDTQNEKRGSEKNRAGSSSRTETTSPSGRFPSDKGMRSGFDSSPKMDEQGRVIEGSEFDSPSGGMGLASGSSESPSTGMSSGMTSKSFETANIADASGITVDVELSPSFEASSSAETNTNMSFGQSSSMRDRTEQLKERSREMASRAREISTDLAARARELPERSRELAGRLDSHARANPWLHLGIAGVTGLTLGYLVGRNQSSDRSPSFPQDQDEFAIATVTLTTTEMGRGYEDFDDALDE